MKNKYILVTDNPTDIISAVGIFIREGIAFEYHPSSTSLICELDNGEQFTKIYEIMKYLQIKLNTY